MVNFETATTQVPQFVADADATIKEFGGSPLFTFTLSKLEPVFKTWIWQITQTSPVSSQSDSVQYLTRQNVASILRLSLPTVDKYTRLGLIPAQRIGNRILYSKEDIHNALEKIASSKFRRK